MITRESQIIFQGISVDEFFARLEKVTRADSQPVEDQNMTVDEAAQFLKLSTPTLHRLKAANAIPFTKIGARVIYRKSELIKWMDSKNPKVYTR